MRLKQLLSTTACAILFGPSLQAAPPPNDNFSAAAIIAGATGSASGTNVEATTESGETYGYRTIWYSWTAPGNGDVTFDTIGSNFDTLLGIYTGSAISSLTPLAEDDSGAGTVADESKASVSVTSGVTYWIKVANFYDIIDGAPTVLNWSLILPPANDNFANATVITGPTGTTTGNNSGATLESGEGGSGVRSIWYQWTAPATGKVVVDTFGSQVDTVLAIYTGSAVNSKTQIGGNNDSDLSPFSESLVKVYVTAGTVYRIKISLFDVFQDQGPVSLNWKMVSQPTNDAFATPATITGASGTAQASTFEATVEELEPNIYENAQSVWFSWVAPFTGVATFDTTGSLTVATLVVGNSAELETFNVVADAWPDGTIGGTASIDIPVISGSTYRIAVASTTEGPITLNWAQNTTAIPSVISLTNATFSAGEAGPAATITLSRNAGTDSGEVSCILYTEDGSADGVVDFVGTYTAVTFAAGATTASVSIPILHDRLFEGEETFTVRLGNPSPLTAFGLSFATVNIADDEPFIPLKANYTGLINVTPFDSNMAGCLKIYATGKGNFTGSLMLGSATALPFVGTFSATGKSTVTIVRKTGGNVLLNLIYADNGNRIRALVTVGAKTANTQTWRIIYGGAVEFSPQALTFTGRIAGQPELIGDVPTSDGFMSISVSPTGVVKVAGRLPDDSVITSSGQLAGEDSYPLYHPLYAGKGCLSTDLSIVEGSSSISAVTWFKMPIATDKRFKGGFTLKTSVKTGPYVYSKRIPILAAVRTTQGAADFYAFGPGLPAAGVTQVFRLMEDNTIALPLAPQVKLTLKFTAATGLFAGTYQLGTEKATVFQGAVFQAENIATGYFLAPGAGGLLSTGYIDIVPAY